MGKRVIYSLTPNRTTQALSNVELAAAGQSKFYALFYPSLFISTSKTDVS
jgi:hypothetical protein